MSKQTIDQAQLLRQVMQQEEETVANKCRVIAIAGGKGGVGKSNVAVNLSCALSDLGKKVLLFDADYGLGNADLILGISSEWSLVDCFRGQKHLSQVVSEVTPLLHMIPCGSGSFELANANPFLIEGLLLDLETLSRSYDFVVLDTGSGISEKVAGALEYADMIIVVSTPEPASLADSYATIKISLKRSPTSDLRILVNKAAKWDEAKRVFDQLDYVTQKYMGIPLKLWGWVPQDDHLLEAVQSQRPVIWQMPQARASVAMSRLAQDLAKLKITSRGHGFSALIKNWIYGGQETQQVSEARV